MGIESANKPGANASFRFKKTLFKITLLHGNRLSKSFFFRKTFFN